MPSTRLVRVVFGILVAATASAFFLTQRLKSSTPVVERIYYKRVFSPNGDGRKETAPLRFHLPEPDDVTVSVVDDGGEEVRLLADDRRLRAGRHSFVWNGRSDAGTVAPDGRYRLRLVLRRQGRAVTAPRELVLDTMPPRPRLHVWPPTLVPGSGARGVARVRFAGPAGKPARFEVYRTDAGRPVRVAAFDAAPGKHDATWDGTVGGRPAPDGVYALTVALQDGAGNVGTAPPSLPPRREEARPRSGTSVRYLTLSGPLGPVRPGEVARFRSGPAPRPYRWRLTRGGTGRPIARGRGSGREIAVRVPPSASTGVHVLHVLSGGRAGAAALAVGSGQADRLPLVVLPVISWQGGTLVDDDRDGFPDTLDDERVVRLRRPLARGLPAPAFSGQVAPLVRFLDRSRLRYELTTDLALARGEGPRIEGRTGVLLAGDERWLPERVGLALRSYVESGGRVASFGVDSLRRRVALGRNALSDPSPREAADIFGERAAPLQIAPAPLVVTGDRIGFFRGTDGFLGLFSRFETSAGLAPGARVLAAGGRDARAPAVVVYRLGSGLVIRVGVRAWSRSLTSSEEVARVTRRIWSFLSR